MQRTVKRHIVCLTIHLLDHGVYQSIQGFLQEVDSATDVLSEEMKNTTGQIEKGSQNMGKMVRSVNESVLLGSQATVQLKKLDEKMNEMNTIIEIINGINNGFKRPGPFSKSFL